MVLDKYKEEVNVGDECIVCKYNRQFKVKIYRITDYTIQYLDWDKDSNTYHKSRVVSYSNLTGSNSFLYKI